MAQTNSVRKSGRQRVPNKKYNVDVFESLDTFDSDSEPQVKVLQRLQDSRNDGDFPENHADRDDDEETLANDVSDGSAILTPEEEYEDAHLYASSDPDGLGTRGAPKGRKRKPNDHASNQDANVHSRGMLENPTKADPERSRIRFFSGSGVEDNLHIVRSRDQWAADATLPRSENMCHQVSHTEDKRQMEATVGWDWYYVQGGRELFAANQNLRTLSLEEGLAYKPVPPQSSHSLLMGPYGRQKVFDLSLWQTLDLEEAWQPAFGSSERVQADLGSGKRPKVGWMLNVGTRVRCLDWAPNHNGEAQYIALAVATASTSDHSVTPIEAPAFTPSCPAPSSIQIWAFSASKNSTDPTRPPDLQLVLCTQWGEITQLKWCPVPRDKRDEDSFGKIPIGLLAGIWGDGCARILDVQVEERHSVETSYLQVESAAFTASSGLLPHANTEQGDIRPVATCLSWLSATDIAIGYSNGALGVFNIYPPTSRLSVPNSHSKDSAPLDTWPPTPATAESNSFCKATNASDGGGISSPSLLSPDGYDIVDMTTPLAIKPWLSLQLHSSYILSLTSAYPTHPDLLISSSLSGHLRLTSLRAPTTDYVLSIRTRTPPSSLAYCDGLLSVVAPEETSETLRLWGLRAFYSSIACGKLGGAPGPGQGIIDVGRCHSSIAAGGADGGVIVLNPMRKALGRKSAGYQQLVFKQEWVRKTGNGPRQGMSRVTEGFKGEKVDFGKFGGKAKDSVARSTIYEEETAVTALGWNPNNTGCGGWLAVGWGSGLVRIQDMAV